MTGLDALDAPDVVGSFANDPYEDDTVKGYPTDSGRTR
jgi:hypothetical protein